MKMAKVPVSSRKRLLINSLLDVASKDVSMEAPSRPEFQVPDTDVDRGMLDEVAGSKGSGIRIESSTESPTRAVSAVQFLSSTITGFYLCQHKLVTASELP